MGLDANQYAIKAQTELLNLIAKNGSCVILGRCADYILRDYHPCKIFIYAPIDFKVSRVTKNYGDDEDTAKINILNSDKKRSKFYKDISGQEWGNRKNYDLCINSSIGIDDSVKIIKQYVETWK